MCLLKMERHFSRLVPVIRDPMYKGCKVSLVQPTKAGIFVFRGRGKVTWGYFSNYVIFCIKKGPSRAWGWRRGKAQIPSSQSIQHRILAHHTYRSGSIGKILKKELKFILYFRKEHKFQNLLMYDLII